MLAELRHENAIVVGIPRGGIPVAAEVARALEAPLDLVLVRKVGAPGNPEYGIGALTEGDVLVIGEEAVQQLRLGAAELDMVVGRARRELAERSARPYARRPRLAVARADGAARRRRPGHRSQRAGGRALSAWARRGTGDPGGAGRRPGVGARVAQVGR